MGPSRAVLVVDDDPDIRDFMSDFLADEGYQVKAAGNGRQALDLLASWRPDVILLDLMMPVMDGWAFLAAQQADAELAHLPVIVMSASYNLVKLDERVPVPEVLAKPFTIEDLLAKVEPLIRGTTSSYSIRLTSR
jgi:two-component system chemotaxis response regulator CheY